MYSVILLLNTYTYVDQYNKYLKTKYKTNIEQKSMVFTADLMDLNVVSKRHSVSKIYE